jgi:hypothetical protein
MKHPFHTIIAVLSTLAATCRLRNPMSAVWIVLLSAMVFARCDSNGAMEPADDTPPQVVRAEATGATQIAVLFDEPLDPASVTPQAFSVSNGVGTPTTVQYIDAVRSATLDLSSPMRDGDYNVAVSGVRDAAGNVLTAAQTGFSFRANPLPGSGPAVGAAYPNAGDSRIILINKAGTRFVYWTPSSGAFSNAEDVGTLENGALPLDDVGAAASTHDEEETYFFGTDGESFTVYERETSEFDEVEVFGDDSGEFGDPEIEDVGAAMQAGLSLLNPNRIYVFNQAGTRYALWDYENEFWTDDFTFPADFGRGGAPIAAVGAALYLEDENAYYLFDREGEKYTIYSGGGRFSSAFDTAELGDGTLSFD